MTIRTTNYQMNNKILRLTIPNIISNISVPLLGMVDLAIVGSIGDKSYIGAIAIATIIFNFVYWGFGFLRMGTSAFTSQAIGARNLPECMTVMTRGVIIAATVSLLILLLQYPIFEFSSMIMNTTEKTLPLVKDYFYIRIWAAPATLMLYVFKGWFIGMQNSKTPMWVSIGINFVNIIFSLIFVFVYDMGIGGVAVGTVIAQYFGLVCCVVITRKYYQRVLRYFDLRGVFDTKVMMRFFSVNRDIFLRTICLIVVFTYFTSASSKMGEGILAMNTLFMQLFTLFSYIMDGFAYAAESLVGKFYGAGNTPLLRDCVSKLNRWGLALSLLFTLLYTLLLNPILSIFTHDPDIFELAHEYVGWVAAVPLCGYLAFLYDGIMIGMTRTVDMRNVIFFAVVLFFALFYGLEPYMGNAALWLGFLGFLLVRGAGQWLAYRRILSRF